MEGESTPVVEVRGLCGPLPQAGSMATSYHEIFDTQGYTETVVSLTTPTATGTGTGTSPEGGATSPETDSTPCEGSSVASGSTEHGLQLDTVPTGGQVYYNEGEGRLVCEEGGDPNTTTKYLTSKLVADSLMWQQTFRNDSPSPEDSSGVRQAPVNDPDCGARPSRPTSLEASMAGLEVRDRRLSPSLPPDPEVLNDLEVDARRLATEVDGLVENLSCILQSVSALTVDTVETYRDGVCKTCDEVDNNIRAMYQLMAKWEELNKNMAPAYRVAAQIKDIKRLLDMFESALG